MSDSAFPERNRLLDAALSYAALGWPVLPLNTMRGDACSCGKPDCDKNAGKHPVAWLVANGLHGASTDPSVIGTWWRRMPDANVGIRTGGPLRIFVVDIDAKDDGDETWKSLEQQYGKAPSTVEALTGGGGRHIFFTAPEGVVVRNSAKQLGRGLDVRGEGGYVVAEPSLHRTGHTYSWESVSAPTDGVAVADAPEWLLKLLLKTGLARGSLNSLAGHIPGAPPAPPAPRVPNGGRAPAAPEPSPFPPAVPGVPPSAAALLEGITEGGRNDALTRYAGRLFGKGLPAVEVRMLLLGVNARQCVPPLPEHEIEHIVKMIGRADALERQKMADDATELFRQHAVGFPGVLSQETVARAAREAVLAEPVAAPGALFDLPGVLGRIMGHALATSVRPVPVYAAQAAIAVGSVVCGRRYMSDQRNATSLYLLIVGKSGTGKDEIKTTIDTVLAAADAKHLIGGSDLTSAGSVYSALMRQPQQIVVLDEFGKSMESVARRDGYKAGVIKVLMEVFSRTHALLVTPQYSAMTQKDPSGSDHGPKSIERPALTVVGLTTPQSFYHAITSGDVVSGFLNRFLVAEHEGARMATREYAPRDVPDDVVAWIKRVLQSRGLGDVSSQREHIQDPVAVPFSGHAKTLVAAFEMDMLRLADQLEPKGLGDLPVRTCEIGMRLGTLAALAQDPEGPKVDHDVLAWAFDYARHFLMQTARAVEFRVADSGAQRARNTVLTALREAGLRGLTEREIHRSPALIALGKRERADAIEAVLRAELAAWTEVRHDGPGRPRHALVALHPDAVLGDGADDADAPLAEDASTGDTTDPEDLESDADSAVA